MTKNFLLFFLFVFVLFPNQALAHTSLEISTPKDGEVITEPIQELTLIFGTKVEQNSIINVSNSNGEPVKLGNFVIEEEEMWATFFQPLENGNYKVDWKIIGADGHPIEGTFSFSVDVPIDEAYVENKGETEEERKQEDNKASNTKKTKQEVQQSNVPSYIIPSISVVLFVVVIGSFLWLRRRKK
ncbi:copper resistance protein CopC [Bacillus sp. ISL-4]|uniref:copper resistance CopC family protein n=1 Tax=Bacillus sp. ISL-4 TaxID=2819125 RepID=UPI001BEC5F61|nr:copper resistance protein CopC [Bacillus sp. ISL-4]MBT2669158.1 copper resistance protein CopC [Bacillus sp. ISL-4]MBT2674358.1 copper resistance protein CopC [Streptomyces sp. ISL-14]